MNSDEPISEKYQRAAQAILNADGMMIAAGAGMGVDSGLPDFRGREGFWEAYPALGKSKIDFSSIASPDAFLRMPHEHGDFMVIGSTCTEIPSRMMVSDCCVKWQPDCHMARLYTPVTSTGSFRKQDFLKVACVKSTVAFIICNA
jgi:hypothetical protein